MAQGEPRRGLVKGTARDDEYFKPLRSTLKVILTGIFTSSRGPPLTSPFEPAIVSFQYFNSMPYHLIDNWRGKTFDKFLLILENEYNLVLGLNEVRIS